MKLFSSVATILCLALAGGAQAATPFEKRVNDLLGVWFQQWESSNAAGVLRVVTVKNADAKSASFVAYFGDPRGTWPEAKDVVAYPEGDGLRVEFASAAGSLIKVQLQADDVLAGTQRLPNGMTIQVRMTRSSVPDAQRWAAEPPYPKVRANKASTIELVFVSASDCPSCRGWEQENLEKGKLKNSAEWPQMKFTVIKRENLKAPLDIDTVPPHLKPLFAKYPRTSLLFRGTPSFVVVVNDTIRTTAWGPAPYETVIVPTLQSAVREKLADAK